MDTILNKLFTTADIHGDESGEYDHTVGDLQDLLRRSWAIMSIAQKRQLLQSDEAANVIECGAQEEFDADDLIEELTQTLIKQGSAIASAGYKLKSSAGGKFFWQTDDEASEDFDSREDAIVGAYQNLVSEE